MLEAGEARQRERRGLARGARVIVALTVACVTIAVAIGAWRWWLAESARPERLEITALEALGPFAIGGEDLPDDWPHDLVAGAMRLRMTLAGDPQRTLLVQPAGDTGSYAVTGAPSRPGGSAAPPPSGLVVPAGEEAEVDLVITPADCGGLTETPVSPLVRKDGASVPIAPDTGGSDAILALTTAIDSLCAPSGPAPLITARSVRVDVFFRDRTLIMRVRVVTDPGVERLVLQPQDSIGFRGGAEQEATVSDGMATARLRWLISPAELPGSAETTVRVRAFAVTGGRAYPWVLDLRVPNLASAMGSMAPPNDGVDLAELAP